jgi:hypothetical protein
MKAKLTVLRYVEMASTMEITNVMMGTQSMAMGVLLNV